MVLLYSGFMGWGCIGQISSRVGVGAVLFGRLLLHGTTAKHPIGQCLARGHVILIRGAVDDLHRNKQRLSPNSTQPRDLHVFVR